MTVGGLLQILLPRFKSSIKAHISLSFRAPSMTLIMH